MNPEISIVIPCFNEEEAIPIFYEETLKVLKTMPLSSFEFVFIDDGSSDRTLEVLKEISAEISFKTSSVLSEDPSSIKTNSKDDNGIVFKTFKVSS